MDVRREQLAGVLQEAFEAEANGNFALAGLLALHALQLDPKSSEAKAIFDRSQAALGRRPSQENSPADLPPLRPVSLTSSGADATVQNEPIVNLLRTDPPSHPLDLSHMPPLTAAPASKGLGSRIVRSALPLLGLVLLLAGLWLHFSRSEAPSPAVGLPVASEPPLSAGEVPGAVSEPTPPPAPGTVALNVAPWARVDAIYSVDDGRIIEPDGLISPCTVSLPPGHYRFGLSHPDFGSVELTVTVGSGQVTKVEHSLISSQELERQLSSGLQSAGDPSNRSAGSEERKPGASGRSDASGGVRTAGETSVAMRE